MQRRPLTSKLYPGQPPKPLQLHFNNVIQFNKCTIHMFRELKTTASKLLQSCYKVDLIPMSSFSSSQYFLPISKFVNDTLTDGVGPPWDFIDSIQTEFIHSQFQMLNTRKDHYHCREKLYFFCF